MANTILITANWNTGALSQQTISRQYDNNRYAVRFVGYPEASNGNELDYYLLVWMSTAPGQKPGEITPIQLNSDQWYISNYFTQQVQVIKFQLCVLNEDGTYEAHSPIFSGGIGDSLEHDGTSHDIDVSTLFDAYREYVEELIIRGGAVIIDPVPTQGSTNAVSSGGAYEALHDTDTTLTQSGQAADAKVVGDKISDVKEDLETNFHINGNVKPNLVVGSFVDATNNSIGASSNSSMTAPIAVKKGQKVTLTATGYNTVVGMIATCNADNTSRTTVVKSIDSSEHDYIYNVTEDGYIVCSFIHNHDYKIAISLDYYLELENVKSSNDTIENTLDFIYEGTENVEIVIYANAFIDATNNRYNSGGNFNITNSVHLFKGQTINLTATGYKTAIGMINIYNSENDTYQAVVRSDGNTEQTYSYTATSECDVRMCYLISAGASANIVTSETDSVRLQTAEAEIDELKATSLEKVEYPQMFTNIICIGDSLTRGESGGSQSVQLSTNYPFYFEKLTGATCYNAGLSGRTTKQWWDEFGSTITGFANYDCAIIYLGTNGGLTDTIETDCNTSDYTQNADTNTGCYGKIIGKIKADTPNCKIFCVAGPSEYLNRDSTMNPAVRHLASFYDVGLIDLSGCMIDDNGTTKSVERYLYRPIDGIHYNRLGYMTLANMIYDYMKVYIKNHLSKYVS